MVHGCPARARTWKTRSKFSCVTNYTTGQIYFSLFYVRIDKKIPRPFGLRHNFLCADASVGIPTEQNERRDCVGQVFTAPAPLKVKEFLAVRSFLHCKRCAKKTAVTFALPHYLCYSFIQYRKCLRLLFRLSVPYSFPLRKHLKPSSEGSP